MSMFVVEIDVSWGDCDPAGIVFYPCYFRWFDAGSHKLMTAAGMDQRIVTRRFEVLGAALVSVQCDFRRPVTHGSRLVHRMGVSSWGERKFVISHTLSLPEGVAVEGAETRVLLARQGEGAARAIAIPGEFRDALQRASAGHLDSM